MSIYDELRDRVKEGRLFFLQPPDVPGSILSRQLYISNKIQSLLDGPWKDEEWEDRCTRLEADFHRFVLGEMINIRMPPSKKVEAYLALLEPPETNVWDIRSSYPEPQLRIFGRFAGKDCFVALTWAFRWYLNDDEDKWTDAMNECKWEWRNLFPAHQPFSGAINDYISKKFTVV